jgi:hypothetical protein
LFPPFWNSTTFGDRLHFDSLFNIRNTSPPPLEDCHAMGALELLVLAAASECTPKHTNSVHHLLPLSGAQIALTQRWLDDLSVVAVFELEDSVLLLVLEGSKCPAVAGFGDCAAEPLLSRCFCVRVQTRLPKIRHHSLPSTSYSMS